MTIERSTGDAVGLEWFKSSHSDSSNSNECIEVAKGPGTVHIRDSKDTQGHVLCTSPRAWSDFVEFATA